MGFFGILSLLKAFVDLLLSIPKWTADYIKSKVNSDSEKRVNAIKEAVHEAKEAKTIEGKADAACKVEKALNPDSTCDNEPGDK